MCELEVLAILGWGGADSFHPLYFGARKVLPCLEGGPQKASLFHVVAPLPSLPIPHHFPLCNLKT